MNPKWIRKFPNIEKFALYNNDKDRVKHMLNTIGECISITPECTYGRKSPEESDKFRNSGNLLLKSIPSDLEEVLKLYAKSILYAPPGSEQLSLAYANRSAVLFRGKYYEECLEDISRALETGYPDSLKPKLLIRRASCNYALTGHVDFETDEGLIEARALVEKLPATNKMRIMVEDTLNNPEKITSVGRQVKKTCPKYQLEMKGRNPHFPGASDAIALRYSEEFGKHLVATRNINSGEVLLIEKPYVSVVANEWIYCSCSHCAKRTWNGIPCDYCPYAMFCSAECKRAAWKEYHDVECETLGFAKEIEIWFHGLMGLRITIKAIREAGSVEALRKRLEELDSVEASDVEIPINPNSYEIFHIIRDKPERLQPKELMVCSAFAGSLTYFLAVRTNLFGKRVTGSIQIVEDSEELLFVASLMLRNIRIARNRTYHVIQNSSFKFRSGEFRWTVKDHTFPEGDQILMIMPVSSFLNNRCYDAAKQLRFNEGMILITYFPISKGDQVFTNYYEDYKTCPRDLRRESLNAGWQFDCNCLACKDNWSATTATSWTVQGLPPRIMDELLDEIDKFKSPNLNEIRDAIKTISFKDEFFRLIDFMYPRVKKPSIEIENLVDTMDYTYTKLSSMACAPFVEKL